MSSLSREVSRVEGVKPPFYRQTDNLEVLRFREELGAMSEDEIYNQLMNVQNNQDIQWSLECFDEIQRRRSAGTRGDS